MKLMKAEVLPDLGRRHLRRIRGHYDRVGELTWAARAYRRVLAHYYRQWIPAGASVLEIGCGGGELLELLPNRDVTGVDLSPVQVARARSRLPHGRFFEQCGEELALDGQTFDVILISDTLNYAADVQLLLKRVRACARPDTRLFINFHRALWRPLLRLVSMLGLRPDPPENSWLSASDVRGLLRLTGWESVKSEARVLVPMPLGGVGTWMNRWVAPACSSLCLVGFAVARPGPEEVQFEPLAVSVVVPVKNERGNLDDVVRRTPEMGTSTEILFVEGGSTDGSWEDLQRLVAENGETRRVLALQQPGRGKADAVRAGVERARGDVVMILDADLTVPPEELPKFYEAVAAGITELANGCRLVYPMEERAMRFLNLCANQVFSLGFSWLLQQRVKDTLCGTKALRREHFLRIRALPEPFGASDPFGDFDLLLGADKLGLKIMDIPIRYQDRLRGQSKIRRWRDGWRLLRLMMLAAKQRKFI